MSPFQRYNCPPVDLFVGLSPKREEPENSYRCILSIRSCRVNGTVVLGLPFPLTRLISSCEPGPTAIVLTPPLATP